VSVCDLSEVIGQWKTEILNYQEENFQLGVILKFVSQSPTTLAMGEETETVTCINDDWKSIRIQICICMYHV